MALRFGVDSGRSDGISGRLVELEEIHENLSE